MDFVGGPFLPEEYEEATVRLSLDLSAQAMDWLARFAVYRNAMAEAQGKKLKEKWSRKSLAEHFIALQVEQMQAQLAAMLEACGPIPDAKDAAAMKKYVAKVVAWSNKNARD